MHANRSFSLFDTPVGACAIVWSARGIAGLQLPEADDAATRRRVALRHRAGEAAPTPSVQAAVDAIQALLHGAPNALLEIVLDFAEVSSFNRRVYDLARSIAPGQTRSYGEVAEAIGEPGAARAVGKALGENPFAIIVPCHRVLAAGGRSGGFSAHGGAATKLKLLEIEARIAPRAGALF